MIFFDDNLDTASINTDQNRIQFEYVIFVIQIA